MRLLRLASSGVSKEGARRLPRRERSGASLVELLCVTALILILAVLFLNHFSSPRPDYLKSCSTNLQKAYLALQIYANDFHGRYPAVAGAGTSDEPLNLLVPHYTVDTGIFICPGSQDPLLPAGEAIRNRKISYAYYLGQTSKDPQDPLMSDRQIDTATKTQGAQVFSTSGFPPGNNHQTNGGNFLFCDGSVQFTTPALSLSLRIPQGVILLNPKP